MIYIVRHGETEYNREGRLQGWIDASLNDCGIELARETGRGMKSEGIRFDAAFSSPLIRARRTAELILHETGSECGLIIDERLKEIHMGCFEGRKFRGEECEVDRELIQSFFGEPSPELSFPGGESIRDVMDRTRGFLREIAADADRAVLAVTHGCALRCMLNSLYDEPEHFWHGHVPYNCCVNIIEYAEGELKLTGDDIIYYGTELCIDRYAGK